MDTMTLTLPCELTQALARQYRELLAIPAPWPDPPCLEAWIVAILEVVAYGPPHCQAAELAAERD